MVRRLLKILLIGGVGCVSHWLAAASLDGTTGTSIYQSATYAFANGDYARGFVRLNNGFSVPVGGVVSLNLLEPVAGQINLNTTGQVTLQGDLELASGASVAAGGGIVDGQGYAVFLNDDLTLPADTVLAFASDTIIDGRNHELVLTNGAPGAQLYINGPAGTKLTLRNLIVRGVRDYTGGDHAIFFGANANQVLELENVIIDLGGNFIFVGGKLSIVGDVMVAGGYSFIYQAAYNCTIHNDGLLAFDLFSTFNYQPSDNSDTHLVFASSSARLLLNQATLFTPKEIGLKLLKGHLVVENKSTLGSNYPKVPTVVYDERLIQMGDGTNANEFTVTYLAGAQLQIDGTMLKNRNRS